MITTLKECHNLYKISDEGLLAWSRKRLDECGDLSYYDVRLICTVASSSLNKSRDIAIDRKTDRLIPRFKAFFFHSLWYHPEGSCLICDILQGHVSSRDREALQAGDLRISSSRSSSSRSSALQIDN